MNGQREGIFLNVFKDFMKNEEILHQLNTLHNKTELRNVRIASLSRWQDV